MFSSLLTLTPAILSFVWPHKAKQKQTNKTRNKNKQTKLVYLPTVGNSNFHTRNDIYAFFVLMGLA